jgi:hypothetical protein
VKIDMILGQIDLGKMALPEFQRGYVWNRDQVRGLMDSLYRRHPVGSLLVWQTHVDAAEIRGEAPTNGDYVDLLLDGQQRVTTLYGVIRGRPPKFFDGNAWAFTGLHFNLADEVFEFYAPLKMKDNPLWIDVTKLMRGNVAELLKPIQNRLVEMNIDLLTSMERLSKVQSIKDIDFHIDTVSGDDKTIDVVVDIFNKVNSGGTKLSKGDLALAKVCAAWPDARDEMKQRLAKWEKAGFQFRLEWYLRCINALLTGEAMFSALAKVDTPAFQQGVDRAEQRVDSILNLISSRLGLDHDEVLGSRYSIPLLCRYFDQRGGSLADYVEQNKVLYWYVHSFLWGRYAGSTESVLNQDLELIANPNGALDRLIAQLRQIRGDLRLSERDFLGWSRGARFYPMLYMLTRVLQARDFGTGLPLNKSLLGKFSTLHIHHIFPKALLYKHGYSKSEANAIANFTFLTSQTNITISDRNPAEYLPEYLKKTPGAIESHWIPMDPALWKVENYPAFLAARRTLLAEAANQFLESLLVSKPQPEFVAEPVLERTGTPRSVAEDHPAFTEDEERIVRECNGWVAELGLPEGDVMHEVADPTTGEPLAVFDLAWPDGLQSGLSQPVALLIEEGDDTEAVANRLGYRFFTALPDFKRYVESEIMALHADAI